MSRKKNCEEKSREERLRAEQERLMRQVMQQREQVERYWRLKKLAKRVYQSPDWERVGRGDQVHLSSTFEEDLELMHFADTVARAVRRLTSSLDRAERILLDASRQEVAAEPKQIARGQGGTEL
jgi:hypothetical protein